MLILQKKEDNVSKIEQLFVKKVAKYKEKEDIFHKNKIEKCLFFKNCFNTCTILGVFLIFCASKMVNMSNR